MLRRAARPVVHNPADGMLATLRSMPSELEACLAAMAPADGPALTYDYAVERLVDVLPVLVDTPCLSHAQMGQVAYALILCALCLQHEYADAHVLPTPANAGATVSALAALWGAVARRVRDAGGVLEPLECVSLLDEVFWTAHEGNKIFLSYLPPALDFIEPDWPRALSVISRACAIELLPPRADDVDARPRERLVAARLLDDRGAELVRLLMLRPAGELLCCTLVQLRLGALLACGRTMLGDVHRWLQLAVSVIALFGEITSGRLHTEAHNIWSELNPPYGTQVEDA